MGVGRRIDGASETPDVIGSRNKVEETQENMRPLDDYVGLETSVIDAPPWTRFFSMGSWLRDTYSSRNTGKSESFECFVVVG